MDDFYKNDDTPEGRNADDDMFNVEKAVQNLDDKEISSTDTINYIIKRFKLIEEQVSTGDIETACENCKRIHILFDNDTYLISPIAKWGGLIKMYNMIGYLSNSLEAIAPLMVMEKMLYFSEFARLQFFEEEMNANMTGYIIEAVNGNPDIIELQIILWSILSDLSDIPGFCDELSAAVPPEWFVNHAALGPERVLEKVCYIIIALLHSAAGGTPYSLALLGAVPHMLGRGEIHFAMCTAYQALLERDDAGLQEALTCAFFANPEVPALVLAQADIVRALWALPDAAVVAAAAERKGRPPSLQEALSRRKATVLGFLRLAQHIVKRLSPEKAKEVFPYVEVADIAIGRDGPDNVYTPVALHTLGFFAARGPECAILVLAETPIFARLATGAEEAPFCSKATLCQLFLECAQAIHLSEDSAAQLAVNDSMWELVISSMANGARDLEHPFWRAASAVIECGKSIASVIFGKYKEELEEIAEVTEDENFESFISLFLKVVSENDPFEEPGASE